MASLVLTRPGWPHPLNVFTLELAKALEPLKVALFSAPLQRFALVEPGSELLEQFRSVLKRRQADRVWLVSTSPSAAYAFAQQAQLLKDCEKALAAGRLVFSGIGMASVAPLLRWAERSSVTVPVRLPESDGGQTAPSQEAAAVTPASEGAAMSVTSADAQAYLTWIQGQLADREAFVLLEAANNRDDLALGLQDLQAQVLRLPLYRREPLPMPLMSPPPASPVFVLLTSSALAQPAVQGFREQGIDPQKLIWLAHHPAIVRAIGALLPGADCRLLSGLGVKAITSGIKLFL